MTFPIDLHIHTTFSDGFYTPTEIVESAKSKGLQIISITDHDSISGLNEAFNAANWTPLKVIPGVEFNTEVGKESVHILGYGFDPSNVRLLEVLAARRLDRVERGKKMVARLHDIGVTAITFDDVLEVSGGYSVGRPHIAKALVLKGHSKNFGDAFNKYLAIGKPAYVARAPFSPEEAILTIHNAGGIAILAHPGKIGDPNRIINNLFEVGLDGLEAYHTDHSAAVAEKMRGKAQTKNLLATVGSDSHGPMIRNVEIGSVYAPDDVRDALFARFLG